MRTRKPEVGRAADRMSPMRSVSESGLLLENLPQGAWPDRLEKPGMTLEPG